MDGTSSWCKGAPQAGVEHQPGSGGQGTSHGLAEFDEEQVEIGGVPTRFLVAGKGRLIVLLHADGDNRLDWR
ncbi:MAG TPA: hypothetical protein VF734_04330 [Pseudonocardiaceae bacterium]|jgi:hypothetical protein